MNIKPTMLMILDGFGIRDKVNGNAVKLAHTPNIDRIFDKYPFMLLEASGEAVGLPKGQIGNSEVGHTNIGAGSIIYQDLPRISTAIKDGSFFKNDVLKSLMIKTKTNGKKLHIMGLLSDGGVHSHIDHFIGVLDMAKKLNLENVIVHPFLDGRDVPPKSAITYLEQLESHMSKLGIGKYGIMSGRFYAMDRDKRWERLELAYDALTLGTGDEACNFESAIKKSYLSGISDEFVVPVIINNELIEDGDSVIFMNFRPDRARELTRALVEDNFNGFKRKKTLKELNYVCMAEYDKEISNVSVAFPPTEIKTTLGSTISSKGLKQLRIAETEKYAHVTFFFNGGKEEKEKGEDRILIDSPKVSTYDLTPEMSAKKITKTVLEKIHENNYDLYILNFANPDMVGHTGKLDAAIKAIESLDPLVAEIADSILKKDGFLFITADHGNADFMLDEKNNPVTKHSTSKVPFVYVSNVPKKFKKNLGKLADISPTILSIMGIDIPKSMTGEVLL